ncbi:MAG: EamA family transporter [Patescibacteria group bacterium]
MWMLLAGGSAVCAALVSIFGKIGLKEVDPTLATIIRGVIMGVLLLVAGFALKKFQTLGSGAVDSRAWLFIFLSAAAGAASWALYFAALRLGPAGGVAVIDKMSVVLIIIIAAFAFGEAFTVRSVLGIILTVIGAVLIIFK